MQAGSSRTLKRMVREYTREEYVAKLDYVRQMCPDVSLSTDIIVGYPGETEADFAETMSLLEYAQYDFIYSFEYSPRPDTPALKLRLRDDVPAETKHRRLLELQALEREIGVRRLGRFVGRVGEVLVEGESRAGGGQLCGRLPGNQMVNFEGPSSLIGTLQPVEIVEMRAHSLIGRAVSSRRLPVVA